MIRAGVLPSLLLGLVAAIPGHAQDRSDQARLDDFALPTAPAVLPVDQVSTGDVAQLPEQHVDRTLGRPTPTEASATTPEQLSSTGGGGAVIQLPSTRASRLSSGTSVSTTTDSTPGSVIRIGGKDRCDPQLAQKFYAECLRILELRSGEFNAPQAPVLSAEQRLLVEQRQREEKLAEMSSAMRLRYATATQPDADLTSNQELAAFYLGSRASTGTSVAVQTEEPADLQSILQDLHFEVAASPPGGN